MRWGFSLYCECQQNLGSPAFIEPFVHRKFFGKAEGSLVWRWIKNGAFAWLLIPFRSQRLPPPILKMNETRQTHKATSTFCFDLFSSFCSISSIPGDFVQSKFKFQIFHRFSLRSNRRPILYAHTFYNIIEQLVEILSIDNNKNCNENQFQNDPFACIFMFFDERRIIIWMQTFADREWEANTHLAK